MAKCHPQGARKPARIPVDQFLGRSAHLCLLPSHPKLRIAPFFAKPVNGFRCHDLSPSRCGRPRSRRPRPYWVHTQECNATPRIHHEIGLHPAGQQGLIDRLVTGSGPMVEIAHTHVVPSARGNNSGVRISPLASRYSRNGALDYSHPRSPNAERSTPGGAYHPAEP